MKLAMLPFLLMAVSAAQAETAESSVSVSQSVSAHTDQLALRNASQWGLQAAEWQRFKSLMQGPLGTYSPNIDPLTALGIEAKSDEERTRYAELQVQMETARVAKLLAYQNAYDQAYKRLYPDLLPVNLVSQTESPKMSLLNSSGRLAVFVEPGCAACESQVKELQHDGHAFDLYLVGGKGNDGQLRAWALKAGIKPDKVRSRQITLNHDGGRWISIGGSGVFPAVLRQDNGRWIRQ